MRWSATLVVSVMVLLTGCATSTVRGQGQALAVPSVTGSAPSRSLSPTPSTSRRATPTAGTTSPTAAHVPAFERLPGYGAKVSTADVDRLTGAAGMLETRVNGSTDPKFWDPICNGTLISINGTLRVMTAAHCLDYSQGHPSTYARPTDVTSGLLYQYGFRRYASAQPAVVLQKAAVAGTADVALFSILQTDPNVGQLPAAAAIPFANPDTTPGGAPVNLTAEAGSQGISTAVINPESGNGVGLDGPRLTTSRIYLGRIPDRPPTAWSTCGATTSPCRTRTAASSAAAGRQRSQPAVG